jgi:hypothetical protein
MPARFPRPCIKCGRLYVTACCLTPIQESPERKLKKARLYGGDYRKRAKLVRENATHCYLCKKPFQPGEDIQADHLYPELGSSSPLLSVHAICNRQKGNKSIDDLKT